MRDDEEHEKAVASAHEEVVRRWLIEPVAPGGADERLFLDCDLASFAENPLAGAPRPLGSGEGGVRSGAPANAGDVARQIR